MTDPDARPRAHWRLSLRAFRGWPRLMTASGVGLAVGIGAAIVAPDLRITACAIAGWDAFCAGFMVLVPLALAGAHPDEIRARSAQQDEGQAVILSLVLAACVASIAAVALDLSQARHEEGFIRGLHVSVALVTVAASWLVTQTMFAVHYAHEYYAVDPATGRDARGLAFPGGEAPDYWDFLHFSMIIGVAAQTADVAFTDKRLRRLGTIHSLIAFAFNTLIVALAINLVAGLF